MKKNYILAIRFGDNDFHSTFRGMFKLIWESYLYDDTSSYLYNKEQLIKVMKQLALPCYIAFQNSFKYKNSHNTFDYHYKHINSYICEKIHSAYERGDILINDEVEKYIKESEYGHDGWFNGELFILNYGEYYTR